MSDQDANQAGPETSPLGKTSVYATAYDPTLLFPISRIKARATLGLDSKHLPFVGSDHWIHYEVSWLNGKGKPMVALATLNYNCNSPNLIESKSLKLYFNSINNTPFDSVSALETTLKKDLEACVEAPVVVGIIPLSQLNQHPLMALQSKFLGDSLDDLDVTCTHYTVEPGLLRTSPLIVQETLCSDLLKSNCLITHQPDWGSVQITYHGPKIDRERLLQYLVSYRHHNEFHEPCIERIFMDLIHHCTPHALTVHGHYTRRGGLDINPYRTTTFSEQVPPLIRLVRQ